MAVDTPSIDNTGKVNEIKCWTIQVEGKFMGIALCLDVFTDTQPNKNRTHTVSYTTYRLYSVGS